MMSRRADADVQKYTLRRDGRGQLLRNFPHMLGSLPAVTKVSYGHPDRGSDCYVEVRE
ncbi:hypothetical protein ACE41H_21360 [Paenibacillus enshidis]|uniref:Uncharacterized protein n=1 Tax=Paenibacillus enshidis TaxID=1458439 RepID=A0ABV5AYL6_9BACL